MDLSLMGFYDQISFFYPEEKEDCHRGVIEPARTAAGKKSCETVSQILSLTFALFFLPTPESVNMCRLCHKETKKVMLL